MRQDVCVYWQIIPLLGLFFSSVLLLNVAIDRLLSLRKFYKHLIDDCKLKYMAAQILPATVFAVGMVVWIYVERTSNEMTVCVVTVPMRGVIYTFFVHFIMVINVLIIVCYVAFLIMVKKVRISNDNMKSIYRSLIVISATVVFGWFSTMLIASFAQLFRIKLEQVYINLLAGLFVNFACAANFFVYYAVRKIISEKTVSFEKAKSFFTATISEKTVSFEKAKSFFTATEYRRVFDEYLYIRHLKKALGVAGVTSTGYGYIGRSSQTTREYRHASGFIRSASKKAYFKVPTPVLEKVTSMSNDPEI
ncbi:hypothetical protein Y032_1131g3662 [Ancylostoma ceylanicum]|uniref:G-protein coupled receptors family 1 profile domain-containing protein n=1 Tax=Ancylostoma ceylanicum TaxID=53326 RepID=A0A016W7A3_9BILA|nr:hypothetical protein Y032_1131g3662 [Ancylostoma ceylanicum]